MANGSGFPQCLNCRHHLPAPEEDDPEAEELFLDQPDRRRWCRKHNFVMPHSGSEVLCSDFRWENGAVAKGDQVGNLDPGFLYYYSYAWDDQAVKLDRFENLQSVLLVDMLLIDDDEFSWTIVDPSPLHISRVALPLPASSFTLRFDGEDHPFAATEVLRTRPAGGHRTESGEWERRYMEVSDLLLYSEADPSLLFRWLDRRMDWQARCAHWSNLPMADDFICRGVGVHLLVLEPRRRYELRFNPFGQAEFMRQDRPEW